MRTARNGTLLGLALAIWGFFVPESHALLLTSPNYSITFPGGWDSVKTASVVSLYGGIGGMATLSCAPGNAAPNLDSLAKFYADSLGGHITKGKDSALTLATYSVHWQEFNYDSLPKLSAKLSVAAGFPVSLKNGTFRVYYLTSNGFVFTAVELALLPGGTLPSKDIESAIKTLKLGPNAGAIREIAGAWGGPEMWIHDGRLGGAWFVAHRPVSIDCFNLRGSWIGSAQPSGTPGIWTLPAVDRNAFLRIVLPDGSRFHLPTRD
jgi:hypothetical protein